MTGDERSTGSRPYRMGKRAEQVERTRERIVEATVKLHTTVGPAQTTISGIAEEASVTRLTVYRHFPDLESLFAACGQRWTEQHPPPNPTTWREIPNLEERARHAFGELYRWFHARGDELLPIMRDREAMPLSVQQGLAEEYQGFADALVIGTGVRGRARQSLRATARLLTSFWTWQSLVVEQGLDVEDAVELATRLLTCSASTNSHS